MLEQHRHGVHTCIGGTAREHLIHHDTQAIDVSSRIQRLITDLFRSHIERCPEHHPGTGELCCVPCYHHRKPKIGNLDETGIVDQDIGRFQVTMDDPNLMHGRHATTDTYKDPAATEDSAQELFFAYLNAEVVARKVLHRNGIGVLNRQKIMNTDNVLVCD